jgi:hypothetical protein
VERFHGTFRPDFLDQAGPFTSVTAAQNAVDAWVGDYNTNRPHQALDENEPVTPADRFAPTPQADRDLIEVWTPPSLESLPAASPTPQQNTDRQQPLGGPVEFDRVIPASGNLMVAGQQFWLGPIRAGQVVRFWADVDVIHLTVGGARIKTVRSHLSINDLARLRSEGAVPAGPPPLPPPEDSDAIEVERTVSSGGIVSLAGDQILAAEILGGRRVGIRIETTTLMFYDLTSRELLRVRPNPLTMDQARRLRGARPAGPPPRPVTEPVRVQRRASNTGIIMICGQKVALGRAHKHQTLTIAVSDTTLAIELDDGETRVIRRTTSQPIRNIKADRPRTVPSVS